MRGREHPRGPEPAQRAGYVVIKLGGSLITRSLDGAPVVERERVLALTAEIVSLGRPVVVVHGTGAFGKPAAIEHGYLGGRLEDSDAWIVSLVTSTLGVLEAEIMKCLLESNVSAFRVPAFALARSVDGDVRVRGAVLVRALMARNLVPVIGGGFVLDSPDGFAVCSSDDIAAQLAVLLDAECLVFATGTKGVHRAHGETEDIYEELRPEDGVAGIPRIETDVSGGMYSKIQAGFTAAAHGVPTFIVDGRFPGNLTDAVAKRPRSGTRLVATPVVQAGRL